MTWNTSDSSGASTIADYFAALNLIVDLATSNHCSAAVAQSDGSGYAVDDLVSIDNTGATKTHDTTLRVTSVSGGAITGLRVETGGAYTSNPSTLSGNNLTAITGGGSGGTANLTFTATGWSVVQRSQEAVSATVASGGSGYTNGDTLTLLTEDAVGQTIAAQFTATVTAGAVTGVSLLTAGLYEKEHGTPANIATSGGTGTGCELNVTFQDADQDEACCILQSSATGTPTVGMRVYTDTDQSTFNTVYNMSLSGFTGFNASLTFANQAGISPGDSRSGGGAYVPLRDTDGSFPISYWFSVTDRRIAGFFAVRDTGINHYPWMYLGFLNQMGTSAEFPYPLYVCGATARENSWYQDTVIGRITGLTECIGITGLAGPGFIRLAGGSWHEVRNSNANDGVSPSRGNPSEQHVVFPCGDVNAPQALPNRTTQASAGLLEWTDVIPDNGVPGTETYKLKPTPDSGGDLTRRFPATVVSADSTEPEYNIKGELDGVFWISGALTSGSITSESVLTDPDNTDRFRVAQNGNKTQDFSYACIRED